MEKCIVSHSVSNSAVKCLIEFVLKGSGSNFHTVVADIKKLNLLPDVKMLVIFGYNVFYNTEQFVRSFSQEGLIGLFFEGIEELRTKVELRDNNILPVTQLLFLFDKFKGGVTEMLAYAVSSEKVYMFQVISDYARKVKVTKEVSLPISLLQKLYLESILSNFYYC